MKKVDYYIKQISRGNHSKTEWVKLRDEIYEWYDNCSEAERKEFDQSGYGEMLWMVCSALETMQEDSSI